MAILNLTPDSFSDGGIYADLDSAVARAQALIGEGADILDLGAESTRPGAEPVAEELELARLLPVLEAVVPLGVPVSVDTYKPKVAREALSRGAKLINDVTGLRNPEMSAVLAEFNAPAVIMHMPTTSPKNMQFQAHYQNVVAEVRDFLALQAERALSAGVPEVILDPGIGFGKTLEHNLALLKNLGQIVALGHSVLVGASRKKTIGELTGINEPAERVMGSVAAHLFAVDQGAALIRVHDVRPHWQALRVWEALRWEK